MLAYEECVFCRHPMTAHNRHQWDGPVCMWCACGDEFVVVDKPAVFSRWREAGIVMLVALTVLAGILVTIGWMERMVLPW